MSDSEYDVKKISQWEATIDFTISQLQCILASHWLIFFLRHNQSQTLLLGSMYMFLQLDLVNKCYYFTENLVLFRYNPNLLD